MQFIVKLAASLAIIIIASQIGRRYPTLGGLIATMPLTSLVVLLWIYSDNPADHKLLREYSLGALWGIAPTILFFAVAFFCLKKQLPFSYVLVASFGAWLAGAFVHQLVLR